MASAPAATAAVIPNFSMNGVLSWRLSNTLTAGFCVEALSEALARFGKPGIFNTDQGAQFTSDEFTHVQDADASEFTIDRSEGGRSLPLAYEVLPGNTIAASIA